ncbi:unnamed protein product [Candidula unifasciata]|uniref:Uncharacterized protein n=1 Tax=Candidula unifasciata TaxID=100452 RepID=A0A8S3YNK6_9EUPU|nr:unnamed protein product [Candidula unifasciata]
MLLDVLTVDSDRLIVTSDRDEKIRISGYPDGYNIQAYCLGHTQFVISLAYDERRKWLISASGDATLRVWTLSGKELCCKSVLSDIPAIETVSGMKVDNTDDALPVDVGSNRQDVPLSLERGKDRQTSRIAIQQICYCSDCQLLFVAIYKSPDILVYRLLTTEHSESVSLQFMSRLSGEGHIASMCVGRCVLWTVRQGTQQLSLAAFQVENLSDAVKLVPVSDSRPTEATVLKTLSSQPDLLQAPSQPLDLIPSLWKTPFQENLKYENNPKRHNENGSKKPNKKQRKLKQ